MEGNNELHLNQKSMIAAVQSWLDSHVLREGHGMKVVSVDVERGAGSGPDAFVVKLEKQDLSTKRMPPSSND